MKEALKSVSVGSVEREIVGLIPAAGKAKRITPLPCSKELFPIGFHSKQGKLQSRPKVVCHYLLEKFQFAGIHKAYIVLRDGKWDIPAYFGDGEFLNMHLSYLMMREPYGPPFTLDQAYPFLHDKLVAFGFPDIMISSEDVFKQLIYQQRNTQADVSLAIFPAHNPQIMDVVEIDASGKIHAMFLKPGKTDLKLCWLCGLWTPVFTDFMHGYLQTYRIEKSLQDAKGNESNHEDLTVGAVLQAAIKMGLNVHGVIFQDGLYLDIGTPDNLMKSVGFPGNFPP